MQKYKLKAEKRKVSGRKVKALRREGTLPANVYGKKVKSLAVQVNEDEFEKVFGEAGETSLVDVSIGKVKKPVLIHNVQVDPVTDEILHIDFRQVDLKEKVKASVPIEVLGESPAEKQGLGTAVQYMDEIEVEALPTDLPEKFEVDITGLDEVDKALHVKDLKFSKDKVKIELDSEDIIVKIEPLRKEEEPEVKPEEDIEGEEPVEGEEPEGEVQEGEAKPEGEEPKAETKPQSEEKKE